MVKGDLTLKFKKKICEIKGHEWIKEHTNYYTPTATYVCKRCGEVCTVKTR